MKIFVHANLKNSVRTFRIIPSHIPRRAAFPLPPLHAHNYQEPTRGTHKCIMATGSGSK